MCFLSEEILAHSWSSDLAFSFGCEGATRGGGHLKLAGVQEQKGVATSFFSGGCGNPTAGTQLSSQLIHIISDFLRPSKFEFGCHVFLSSLVTNRAQPLEVHIRREGRIRHRALAPAAGFQEPERDEKEKDHVT